MSSGDESGVDAVVSMSERETQFVERSDDDETLWEVEKITAERTNAYKVKWVGCNPATGKPWPQDWVPKHDCTDLLVAQWKAEQRQKKGDGRTGMKRTASRASGSSKRTESSSSRRKTRTPGSEATTPRVESVVQDASPSPPPKTSVKRRRQSETPATTISGGTGKEDEEGETSRPKKKRKTILEVLVPPLSSDEESIGAPAAKTSTEAAPRKNVSSKHYDSDEGTDLPPPRPKDKGKGKSIARSDGRSRDARGPSKTADAREGPKRTDSKSKTKVARNHKERIADTIVLSDESDIECLRPPSRKSQSLPKRKYTPEKGDDVPRNRAGSAGAGAPVKVGPPRGVRRREVSIPSQAIREPQFRPSKPKEIYISGESAAAEESANWLVMELPSLNNPSAPPLTQDMIDITSTPSPPRTPIPDALPVSLPRTPDLSPGALQRLELFDQMIAELDIGPPVKPLEESNSRPDPGSCQLDELVDPPRDTHSVDIPEPPRPSSPPPSKYQPKHTKIGTPNGLVVPETESSGNSQSRSQSPLKPSSVQLPPAHPQVDLPTIAIIDASPPSSEVSAEDLMPQPQRSPTFTPLKRRHKLAQQVSPNTFRSKITPFVRTAEPEAPPSSIESFTSPKRVDKGKQRAVQEDQILSLSEGEGDRNRSKNGRITDSDLKKRGKELFDQTQLAREAERQKTRKIKRLKTVSDIVNGGVSSSPKRSPFPLTGEAGEGREIRWDEVVDMSGGMNSTTLDSPEHSEARPMTEEERNRWRIELRQEEEENTQEAMLGHPQLSTSTVVNGRNAIPVPTLASSKHSLPSGDIPDIDRLEHLSTTDLQQVSVIVQASQEPRHEDTDMDPSQSNQLTSSPPRPIPANLTDSPKRRLGEALSLLNVKSEEIQRLERELSEEREKSQGLKAELAGVRQSSEPTGPVRAAWEAERARWAEERCKWESDSSAWQTERKAMSEERTSFLARVAELSDAAERAEQVRIQLSALEVERDAWKKERDTLLNNIAQRQEELAALTQVHGDQDQDHPERVKWEVEKASWVEEKAEWDSERTALQERQESLLHSLEEVTTSLESQRSATASAQKDRDFFREQYVQASAFVSSVRDENLELEKRVKIAEGQAHEGVATIKVLYEGRLTALHADVARWKGLAELLQERDRRTDDELRTRAAQVPELVDHCDRISAENRFLESEIWKLGRAQQCGIIQRKGLCRKVLLLQNERKLLRSKLSKVVKITGDRSQTTSQPAPAPSNFDDPDSVYHNDSEVVPDPIPHSSDHGLDDPTLFPCLWRPQWRDQCQLVFDAKEDLERHVQEHFHDLLTQ